MLWKTRHLHLLFRCITKTRLFKYIENFTTKNWIFSDNNSDIFHISAQNIDCGYSLEPPRRGASNGYPQSVFCARRFRRVPSVYVLSRNKKNNVYPCKPQFYYIKVGFNGSKLYRLVFVMEWPCSVAHHKFSQKNKDIKKKKKKKKK